MLPTAPAPLDKMFFVFKIASKVGAKTIIRDNVVLGSRNHELFQGGQRSPITGADGWLGRDFFDVVCATCAPVGKMF